ncbi:AAA family ATPase [Hoeflea sp. WL0058]|uniref:AAA family ATPase n=1 Tax=Flavimaribacter sediminis TaxID=2865987 RepID=A0AAE2ZUA2_9HYPH|nr:AAA family ATPase [Flavimaribacter sediminis]MBW8640498.1 AAA family ATPase [Flavimaribacter sediminis]
MNAGERRFFVLSGCSGGGKSTLLSELAERGYATVEEPGRRIVRQELGNGGAALPWRDPAAFARRAVALAQEDWQQAQAADGPVFFDRGLVDAAAALEHATGKPFLESMCSPRHFHHMMFLAQPWPELFGQDTERRHDFGEAVAEFERLVKAYRSLNYTVVPLPKAPVQTRADFVVSMTAV